MPKDEKLASLQKQFLSYLRREGPYNYGQLVREIEKKPEAYIKKTYDYEPKPLRDVLEGVFGNEFGFQMTIEEYLEKVRVNPNFGLRKPGKV